MRAETVLVAGGANTGTNGPAHLGPTDAGWDWSQVAAVPKEVSTVMRAVVVYESMFGGTKAVAEAAANGISSRMETRVVRAADAMSQQFEGVDLVVVGAPTHAHGLPRPSTRKGAPNYVKKANGDLMLEPGADSVVGVREWLSSVRRLDARCAAFDTRANGPGFLTGRASKTIARVLKNRGASLVASPQSFLTKGNKLVSGELERASAWGESLAGQLVPAPMS